MLSLFLIGFYLLFLTSLGGFIVCAFTGSWIAAYDTKDLCLIYFLNIIASGTLTCIVFNIMFITPI
ncbi:hypothetical protein [Clostridium sp. CH2]|uniref:hypothetical protein n=1 Tax=Clostridium sp. CH2 TaxID=2949990 RepID=UPI00207942C8|nr:hypothetical protein [Clostridium sp. CH2]